jgi:hypothetical protein
LPHTQEAIWENGWDTILAELRSSPLDVEHEYVHLYLVAFDDQRQAEECIGTIHSVIQQSDPTAQRLPTLTMKNCLAAWRLSKSQNEATVLLLDNQMGEKIAKGNCCWPQTKWTLVIQLSKPSSLGSRPNSAS